MKKLLTILTLLFGMFSYVSAQQASQIVQGESIEKLQESKKEGSYVFVFPQGTTEEFINEKAKYYTTYFDVVFNSSNNNVTVTMKDNNEKSRMVVTRFLKAADIWVIVVNNENLKVDEFMKRHL